MLMEYCLLDKQNKQFKYSCSLSDPFNSPLKEVSFPTR